MAKEEKLGFIYIKVTFYMLFFQNNAHPRKAIPYAKLCLREGRTIFEETFPTDLFPLAFQHTYIYCFEVIGYVYMAFYQISTQKNGGFFYTVLQKYMYGGEITFYECRLKWELMCRNTDAIKKTSRYIETNPIVDRCYICANELVNQARIMLGKLDAALTHSANVISGNIPLEARDDYESCQHASTCWQYSDMFETCLYSGRLDLLNRILPLTYKEILADEENTDIFFGK